MTRRTFMLAAAAATATATAGTGLAGCASARAANASSTASQAFQRRAAEIEATLAGGRLGVGLIDMANGARYAWRGDERFPMCSTAKLGMAAALLRRVDLGQERLDRAVVYATSDLVTYSPMTQPRVGGAGVPLYELCDAAMTLSDNTAGNLIMRPYGGPAGFTAFFREIGDSFTRLDRWETDLNTAIPGDERDTTTPSAMATSMRKFVLGDALTPKSRHHLMTWLLGNKVGDTRLRAGVPSGWLVGDKTGTGANGTVNDIGVLLAPNRAPMVATVYITGATAVDRKVCEAAIAQVAGLAAALA